MRGYKQFLLQLLETFGVFKLLRWRNRHCPQVIMYHRVNDDPSISGLPSSEFEKQIAYIAKHFRVVPIETLIQEIKEQRIRPYTIAITFDDGHSDFYEHAWPVLKKYKAPVSLYITTSFVNKELWLWPDLLKYVMLNCTKKQINIFPMGELSFTQDSFLKSWNILGDHCLTLTSDSRNKFIAELAYLSNCELPPKPVTPFLPVTWDQLKEMISDGLDIGSHTVSHPILSGLDTTTLRHELIDSANIIRQKLGYQAKGICYPNGRLIDINNNVIYQAEKCGYHYGLLARNHPINANAPFLIGRLSTHTNFNYFKWILTSHPTEQYQQYFN
ncbi:MAG TPA: polysaccharide deacetylase family protein [Cellvibrio sp.]